MTSKLPSLPDFERLVCERNYEAALLLAFDILNAIDGHYGAIDGIEWQRPINLTPESQLELFATRFAAAFGHLLSDPTCEFSPLGFELLLSFHRWIDLTFLVSGFGSSDHLLHVIGGGGDTFRFDGHNLLRFFGLFSLSSNYDIDFAQCQEANPAGAAVSFLNYLATRYCYTERAFAFRERLLEWLPGRLGDVRLGEITLAKLMDPYMQCSYAITPRKHAIKADLVALMRRACLDAGCREMPAGAGVAPARERPCIVVVAERFNTGHAVVRTHSRAVRALRQSFRVIGVGLPDFVSEAENYFDEFIEVPAGDFLLSVRATAERILAHAPDIVFHLGVGMTSQTVALATLRLARVQCVSFGHTATTMSPAIDYMILPEDFVGARDLFSEKLVTVLPAAMPYAPRRSLQERGKARRRPQPRADATVRIAVPATIMKLNPLLFRALAKVVAEATTAVEFQFMPGFATGLVHRALIQEIRTHLPEAIVHPDAPYELYLERLRQCDLFVSPFPYGNMNSIIDAASVGLPGVCLDGPEAHAHADAAIFTRIGFPPATIATSIDGYVAATVRMVDDAAWRAHCTQIAVDADLEAAFVTGDESLFCRAMEDLLENRA